MEHEVGIRMRANGVVETTRGVELTGDAVEKLGQRTDAVAQRLPDMDRAQRDAAGGARVLGGAMRDAANDAAGMLGVPAAARTAVLSLSGGLGIASAAALALGAAYVQGGREDQAFRQNIVLTGNAAGVTSGMLRDMAVQISANTGTQREAAAALSALVGNGQVAANQLDVAARAAVRLESVAGVAVGETVLKFEALGRDPTRAAAKLNESTNFLTRSLYEQIRAAEAQGRSSTAAALAQAAYADAMDQRAAKLEGSLGIVERSWRAITGAAKGAWDAMLDIGREQTLQQKIASVEAQLQALDTRRSPNPALTAQRRAVLAEQREALLETERLAKRAATAQAEEAARTRDYVAQREAERDKKAGAGRTATDPSARLDDAIQRRLALAQAEMQAGEQLSQADRFRIDLLQQIDDVQARIGQRRAAELRTAVESTAQQMRAVELQRAEAKEREAAAKAFAAEREAATRQAYAGVQQLAERNRTLAEETATIGLSAQALEARRQAQIDAEIADRAAHLARIDGLPAYAEEAAALQQQIELLRERKALQAGKATAEAQDQERKADEQRRDGIADSITQGLMDGFRNGRSLTDIFLREMQAQFAATMLRPTVNYLVEGALGSGGSGGLLGQAFGFVRGLFGGGLARGGAAQRGRLYEVNETGLPEVVTVGARSFVMMGGQDGQVSAARGSGGGATAAAPAARSIVYSPTTYIDSRTDRAEVAMLMERSHRQAMAQLVEMMDRGQV